MTQENSDDIERLQKTFTKLILKQGLKSLNPRPTLNLCDCGKLTSMQNLESVAQKMAEL